MKNSGIESPRACKRPTSFVPVNGKVLEGKGAVDAPMVTGESMPTAKQSGDKLIEWNRLPGHACRQGRPGRNAARIVAMVAAAERSGAPIQRTADTVSVHFVPIVLGVLDERNDGRGFLPSAWPGSGAC
jgi:P-type Cu+ transporter